MVSVPWEWRSWTETHHTLLTLLFLPDLECWLMFHLCWETKEEWTSVILLGSLAPLNSLSRESRCCQPDIYLQVIDPEGSDEQKQAPRRTHCDKAAPETQGFQSQQRGRLKVYPRLISVSPNVLVSLGTMLLSKVDVTFGHKASKSGSLSSKQCQKLSRVLNTFLPSLNQLVLWLTT